MTPNKPPMSSESADAERVRLEGSRVFWEQMLARLDVDARALDRIAMAAPIALIVAFVALRSWMVELGIATLVAAVWGMGRYMVGVRRVEYRYHISDIHQQLSNLSK